MEKKLTVKEAGLKILSDVMKELFPDSEPLTDEELEKHWTDGLERMEKRENKKT